MKLISKSIVPKGKYTHSAIVLLIAILYFIQQVDSLHMAFLTPDINIINIYPIHLINDYHLTNVSQSNVYASGDNSTNANANYSAKETYTLAAIFY